MDVWQLAINSTGILLAFIAGVFAEPIKSYFANQNEKQRLRLALYREMVFVYGMLIQFIQKEDLKTATEIRNFLDLVVVQFDCYNYAKSNPVIFHQLEEAAIITASYSLFSLVRRQDVQELLEAIEKAKDRPDRERIVEVALLQIKHLAALSVQFFSSNIQDGKFNRAAMKKAGIQVPSKRVQKTIQGGEILKPSK